MAAKTTVARQQPSWKIWARRIIYSPLPAVSIGWSLLLSEVYKNRSQLYIGEAFFPLIMTTLPIIVGYYIFWHVSKKQSFVTITASSLLAIVLYNFNERFDALSSVIRSLLPLQNPKDSLLVLIVLAILIIICGLLALAFSRGLKFLRISKLPVMQLIVLAALFVGFQQILRLGLFYTQYKNQYTYQPPKLAIKKASPEVKPDIYYFVLDRYTSQKILTDQYSFDNSAFLDGLKERGFVVRDAAWSNYPFTAQSISSTLSLNYLTHLEQLFKSTHTHTDLPLRAIFNRPPIAEALQSFGYEYDQVGSWWGETHASSLAKINHTEQFTLSVFGRKRLLSEFEGKYFEKSVFRHFLMGKNKLTNEAAPSLDERNIIKSQFKLLDQLSSSPGSNSRFVFAHILSPHPPYVFNPDGSRPAYSSATNDDGTTEQQKYLNQLQYTNNKVSALIDNILRHAKTPPIIIFQADEGPYPLARNDFDVTSLSLADTQRKFGILSAYYLPNTNGDELAQANSSVNIFRLVLNKYFGQKFDYLPDCSFAFSEREQYLNFVDYTTKLRGNEDPRCKAVH